LSVTDGEGQAGSVSPTLVRPLIVPAFADGNGAPLAGVQVTFTAPSGGHVSPAVALTDATGRASTPATLPRALGTVRFVATATGPDGLLLPGAPLVFAPVVEDLTPGVVTTLANRAGVAGRTSLAAGVVASTAAALKLEGTTASGVAVDPVSGAIFVAETDSHRVVKIDADGALSLVAGSDAGTAGFVDNVAATSALLNWPFGLALDGAGHLYIAGSRNNRVRRVDAATGIITTAAGGGTSTADGVLATQASLGAPVAVLVRPAGELVIQSRT